MWGRGWGSLIEGTQRRGGEGGAEGGFGRGGGRRKMKRMDDGGDVLGLRGGGGGVGWGMVNCLDDCDWGGWLF